jgi:hypothetical protein
LIDFPCFLEGLSRIVKIVWSDIILLNTKNFLNI